MEIHPDILLLDKEIGKGSFASVYLGKKLSTNQDLAIKVVNKQRLSKKIVQSLESEIRILKKVIHPHIVQLIDIIRSEENIYLVMEFCELGDLSSFIKHPKVSRNGFGGLSEDMVLHFVGQLASAMEFLRGHSLIHRDIKPQNILMSHHPEFGSDVPLLKIADFGFARALPSTSMASTLCGSPLYMAPEILKGDRYDAKSDLWSLGAVLYECYFSKPPFRAQNHIELLKKIENDQGAKFPDELASPGMSPRTASERTVHGPFKDLVKRLLKKNPVERISFEEFLLHPCVLKSPGFTRSLSFMSPERERLSLSMESSVQTKGVAKEDSSSQSGQSLESKSIQEQSSLELEPPFPGYDIHPLVFSQSEKLSTSRVSEKKYVDSLDRKAGSRKSKESVQLFLSWKWTCPWNTSRVVTSESCLESEEGLCHLYASMGHAYQSFIDLVWSSSDSSTFLEEKVYMYLICLEFYQFSLDMIRKSAFKRMLTVESKNMFDWILLQFDVCLNKAQESKALLAGKEEAARNIFLVSFEWIQTKASCQIQNVETLEKWILILESVSILEPLLKESFLLSALHEFLTQVSLDTIQSLLRSLISFCK